MKTAIICFYSSFPVESGAASVTYSLAKFMKNSFLIQMGNSNKYFSSKTFPIFTLPPQSQSPWIKLFRLNSKIRLILTIISKKKPDVIILEGASWVVYHYILLRQLRNLCPSIKIFYHAHNVEYVLRKEKSGFLIGLVTKFFERKLVNSVDLNLTVSQIDSDHFSRLYGVNSLILPNGVDLDRFENIHLKEVATTKLKFGLRGDELLFMGSYFYYPNKQALDFIVQKIMPTLLKSNPKLKLVTLGTEDLPYDKPWLINLGLVNFDDLPKIVKSCGLGLAPIFSGSGTRLKILEYMAAGLPVVSTIKGCEGLNVQDGVELIIADEDAVSFAKCVESLLLNLSLQRFITKNALNFVKSNFNWSKIIKDFKKNSE
ncbi:MAG: hypothetical protein RLZ10_1918 [Bacteroidota bacterium]|jgi:glycosyltransferase involved in cell wall biosynthesis